MGAEEAEEEMQACLIMYDDHKGAFWAAGFRAKGVSEAIVKYVNDLLGIRGREAHLQGRPGAQHRRSEAGSCSGKD